MAGGGDNRGGTGALELGLMNALRTGNRNVDLFVVAFLPTLIALVATSSERLRDVIRSAAGNGLRRKKRFERIVRVERRPTRWGRGSKIEPEAKNEVLQKAIAWHLVRCGALDGADDAKLRLLARGASEKGAGRHRWNKSFGTTSALLRQYDVVSAVPDDVWVSVPGAPGDLKVMRAVDDGREDDKEEGKDNSTTSVDFRLTCDELAPIEAFLETAFDAYVEQTAKEEAGGRHLYVRAGGGGAAKDDDSDDGSGAATYKRYRLAASKTFDSLFFPEKDELLALLDAFHAGTGRFAVKGSPKKLGVLLHGPPGTGKTSLIKALAARLDRSIVSIPLGRIKTNQELFDAVFDMKYGVADADVPVRLTFKQTVFVLEDVDAASSVVLKRSSSTPEPVAPVPAPAIEKEGDPIKALLECLFNGDDKAISGPTMALGALKPTRDRLDLSGILNVLDGVVDTPDRILIMTTNHPERLDPALVRPGRVDVRLRLGYVQRTEARQMVEHYVLRRPMDALEMGVFWRAWDSRASQDVTPAELEQMCAACDDLAEVVSALADGDGQASRWAREKTVGVA